MAWIEQAHADAILALLEAAPGGPPALVIYDGKVPDKPAVAAKRYVLVYFVTSRPDGSSLTADQDIAITRAYCHCVGETAAAARAVSGIVAAALVGAEVSIAGRVCWPIRDDDSSAPPRRDESTGVQVMDAVSVYRLKSVPAT